MAFAKRQADFATVMAHGMKQDKSAIVPAASQQHPNAPSALRTKKWLATNAWTPQTIAMMAIGMKTIKPVFVITRSLTLQIFAENV